MGIDARGAATPSPAACPSRRAPHIPTAAAAAPAGPRQPRRLLPVSAAPWQARKAASTRRGREDAAPNNLRVSTDWGTPAGYAVCAAVTAVHLVAHSSARAQLAPAPTVAASEGACCGAAQGWAGRPLAGSCLEAVNLNQILFDQALLCL